MHSNYEFIGFKRTEKLVKFGFRGSAFVVSIDLSKQSQGRKTFTKEEDEKGRFGIKIMAKN